MVRWMESFHCSACSTHINSIKSDGLIGKNFLFVSFVHSGGLDLLRCDLQSLSVLWAASTLLRGRNVFYMCGKGSSFFSVIPSCWISMKCSKRQRCMNDYFCTGESNHVNEWCEHIHSSCHLLAYDQLHGLLRLLSISTGSTSLNTPSTISATNVRSRVKSPRHFNSTLYQFVTHL